MAPIYYTDVDSWAKHILRFCFFWLIIAQPPFVKYISEGSLGVKLPTIWTDKKQSRKSEEKVRENRRSQKRKSEKVRRKRKGKSRSTVFFQWFVAPESPKVGSLKRRVRSQLARWKMNNCTLWREAHFQVKMYKTPQVQTAFGPWDVEEVHLGVTRSTFPSQKEKTDGLRQLLEV